MAVLSVQQGACASPCTSGCSCKEPSSCAGHYVAILFVVPCHGHCRGGGWAEWQGCCLLGVAMGILGLGSAQLWFWTLQMKLQQGPGPSDLK